MAKSGAARAVRLANNLSLEDIRREAQSQSRTTILRWERGERTPRGEAALRYGRVLKELMRQEMRAS